MKLFESMNEYGIPVAHFLCDRCGVYYSIAPAPTDETGWNVCSVKPCASYDPARDLDHLFE